MKQKGSTDAAAAAGGFVDSGVPGMDNILGGGFPKGRPALLTGPSGTGKSILGSQFIYSGAKNGEAGAIISFDEESEDIIRNMEAFGWGVKELIDSEMMKVEKVSPIQIQQFAKQESIVMLDIIRSIGAKRIVIDSLTTFEMMFSNDYERLLYMRKLIHEVLFQGCTLLAISEAPIGSLSRFGIAEYVFDTVVLLDFGEGTRHKRTVQVIKKRGGAHSMDKHPMAISNKGIEVRQD